MEEEEEVLIPFIARDRGVHFGLTTARNKCRHKRKEKKERTRKGEEEEKTMGRGLELPCYSPRVKEIWREKESRLPIRDSCFILRREIRSRRKG